MAEEWSEARGDLGAKELGDADDQSADEGAPDVAEPSENDRLERIERALRAGCRRERRLRIPA